MKKSVPYYFRCICKTVLLVAALPFGAEIAFAQSAVSDDFLKKLRDARDEMEQNFQNGQAALQAGDYEAARQFFEKVQLKNRNYRNVMAKLREIDMALEQNAYLQRHASKYQQALEYEQQGEPALALQLYREIAHSNAAYKDIQRRIAACEKLVVEQQKPNSQLAGRSGSTHVGSERSIGDLPERPKNATSADLESPAKVNAPRATAVTSAKELIDTDQPDSPGGSPSMTLSPPDSDDFVAENQSKSDLKTAEGRIEQTLRMRNAGYEQHVDSSSQQRMQSAENAALAHIEVRGETEGGVTPTALQTTETDARKTELLLHSRPHSPGEARPAAPQNAPDGPSALSRLWVFAPLVLLPLALSLLAMPVARARYFLVTGQFPRAAECYERILRRNPGNVKMYLRLSTVYLILGRTDAQAITIYKTAVQLSGNAVILEQLRATLTDYYLEQKELDSDAIKLLESVVRLRTGAHPERAALPSLD